MAASVVTVGNYYRFVCRLNKTRHKMSPRFKFSALYRDSAKRHWDICAKTIFAKHMLFLEPVRDHGKRTNKN